MMGGFVGKKYMFAVVVEDGGGCTGAHLASLCKAFFPKRYFRSMPPCHFCLEGCEADFNNLHIEIYGLELTYLNKT